MAAVQARHSETRGYRAQETHDAILAGEALRDSNAFGALYLLYADRVFRFCYRRVGSREAAEDATSLVFTKALAGLGGFDSGRGTFAAWLFSIANHVLADQFRSERRYLPGGEFDDIVDATQSPEEIALAREGAGELRRALGKLAPREREVIELRLAGLNSAEIGAVLGCRKNAVAQAQFRAVNRLRTLLGPGTALEGIDNV